MCEAYYNIYFTVKDRNIVSAAAIVFSLVTSSWNLNTCYVQTRAILFAEYLFSETV